jgi:hypothetical protein
MDFVIPEVVMLQTTPHAWDKFVGEVRDRIEATLERMADSIKDLLLDAGEYADADFTQPVAEDLPPLPKEAFLAALRPRIEETLGQLADALNEMPSGKLSAIREEHLAELLVRLWCEGLELGQQMRSDAANTGLLPVRPPQGEWARRYRRMHPASPGGLPCRPGPGNCGSP